MPYSKSGQTSFETLLHHSVHKNINTEILEIGIFQLFINLARFSVSLSLIFHLYNDLNYAVWQICAFYLVLQLPFPLVIPFAGKIIQKIGIKHAIALKAFTTIPTYLGMAFLLTENVGLTLLMMMPILFLRAIGRGASEVAFDVFLIQNMNEKKKGKSTALMQISIIMAGILAPICGAFVSKIFGFEFVVYLAILFALIAGWVLFLTPDQKFTAHFNAKKLIIDSFEKPPKPLYISEWGRVFFDCVLWIIWPIFLILTMKDLVNSALVMTASATIAMGVAYFIGKKVDQNRDKPEKILKQSAYRSSLINFGRAIWSDPLTISGIDAISKINDQTLRVPYNVQIYQWIKKKNSLERSNMRWFIAEGYYSIQILGFLVFFYFYPDAPIWVFVFLFFLSALCLSLTSWVTKINAGSAKK